MSTSGAAAAPSPATVTVTGGETTAAGACSLCRPFGGPFPCHFAQPTFISGSPGPGVQVRWGSASVSTLLPASPGVRERSRCRLLLLLGVSASSPSRLPRRAGEEPRPDCELTSASLLRPASPGVSGWSLGRSCPDPTLSEKTPLVSDNLFYSIARFRPPRRPARRPRGDEPVQ